MKEAFEVMGSHPLLIVFLGIIFVIALIVVSEMILDIFKRK